MREVGSGVPHDPQLVGHPLRRGWKSQLRSLAETARLTIRRLEAADTIALADGGAAHRAEADA